MSATKQEGVETETKRSAVVTHFFTPIKFAKISKRVFKRLLAGQYQELENDLSTYQLGKEQIKDFFLAEGYPILQWAIVRAVGPEALSLLCKLIDKVALGKVLLSHNMEILQDFLLAEAGLERNGVEHYDRIRVSQIEKIRLMLCIDYSAVENFIKAKVSAQSRCVTKNIELNFNEALAALSKQEDLSSCFTVSPV